MILKSGDKIAIVGCSNAQSSSYKTKLQALVKVVAEIGLVPVCSDFIFTACSGEERARALMEFYSDMEIKAIFDISGGDIANEILEYVDFDLIKNNIKPFFGYSDLTTILNAIYSKTEDVSYLYQIRNLMYDNKEFQVRWFVNSLFCGEKDLFDFKYSFIQGDKMEGIVVGGNIRCLLKLAGTPYFPNCENKILFLEAYSGDTALITTFFSQLKHMGVFSKINGILLGTFTKMEENNLELEIENILKNVLKDNQLPIAKTREVGHGTDSKCIAIGAFMSLK